MNCETGKLIFYVLELDQIVLLQPFGAGYDFEFGIDDRSFEVIRQFRKVPYENGVIENFELIFVGEL